MTSADHAAADAGPAPYVSPKVLSKVVRNHLANTLGLGTNTVRDVVHTEIERVLAKLDVEALFKAAIQERVRAFIAGRYGASLSGRGALDDAIRKEVETQMVALAKQAVAQATITLDAHAEKKP